MQDIFKCDLHVRVITEAANYMYDYGSSFLERLNDDNVSQIQHISSSKGHTVIYREIYMCNHVK